ncbi:MAG: SAM-dependent methyltransferase [Lachnospiraceae bacterium]|jgi:SAM-dependent methyltransferase|nr:SAM-dependent methyltransferase [Lachnospiraceae bacterium]
MEELKSLLEKYLNRELLHMVISGAKGPAELTKVRIRPVLLKEELRFQAEIFRGTKAFHENLKKEEAAARISQWMQDSFRQLQLAGTFGTASVLVSKKGKVTIKEKTQNTGVKAGELAHNKKKHYLLEEGRPIDFLVDLGVMTQEGKVVHARYDKFRQINRFLEFIEDVLPALPRDREIAILDFGCGKSYLTFAMYYYLKICRGLDIRITGLDLKEDVILHCSELAEKYGYEKLNFLKGDIAGYEGEKQVDMVVTLHACDTATDYALYKAVNWNARVILSVPCCQHELNRQIYSEQLAPVLKHGLLKERIAALVTDGLRAELLEQQGYAVQVLEFIDMEHTPKNILIRAVKRSGENQEHGKAYEACTQALHVHPTLERLLKKQPAGKVNLPERQREGALGHIPLCPEDADRSRKGAAG